MEFEKEENNHHHLQFSDTREEEEEEGEEEEEEAELFQDQSRMINKVINPTTSYSHHHHQQQQLPLLSSSMGSPSSSSSAAAKKWMSNMSNEGAGAELFLSDMSRMSWGGGERERQHMFDKVVTPSDVGKLNRLVIPKQHAEKYFPLDPTTTDKGLLLNFEDRTGKCWRFRYSYWNSSQSYVMTKGWSRFVKEKKLDAGDIVSFHRSSSSASSNSPSAPASLFIDWRRRPTHHHYPNADHHYPHHHQSHNLHHHPYYQHYQRWGYSLPNSPALPPAGQEIGATSFNRREYLASSINNHSNYYYYGQHVGVLRPPILFESVPVTAAAPAPAAQPKRLRLFGVNMECSPSQDDANDYRHRHQITSSHQNQVRLQNNNSITSQLFPLLPTTTTTPTSTSGSSFPEFSQKGKSSATSLSFDLDP